MTATDRWIDLLDPTAEALSNHVPESIHARAMEQLLAPSTHDDEPRAKLEGHGDYVFGVLLVAVEVPDEDQVYYQELNLIMTHESLLTIRKTPPGGRPPYDPSPAQLSCRDHEPIGMVVYHLVDDIAERFLDLVDALTDEIEELEEGIDQWDSDRIRRRISGLRHDMLNIRRTLSPLRDAIRQVVDDRIDFEGEEVFPREVELNFAAVYDVHRRPLRPELRRHPRTSLALWLRLRLGSHCRDNDRSAHVLQVEEVALGDPADRVADTRVTDAKLAGASDRHRCTNKSWRVIVPP